MQYPRNGYILGLQRTNGGSVLARMLSVHTSAVRRGPYTRIFSEKTSVPDGYGMKALVAPYNEDNISSFNQVLNADTLTGPLVTAKNMSASFNNSNTMTSAMKSLVQCAVGMVATCNLTPSMRAAASMAVNLANAGNISASLKVFAFIASGLLNQTNILAGPLLGISRLSADITTEGAVVTANSCANAVWEALAASHDTAGTMGALLNGAGAAGDPWATVEGQAIILRVYELYKIHGLKSGSPMTVTPTTRDADDVHQTISGDGTTSTTVTRV